MQQNQIIERKEYLDRLIEYGILHIGVYDFLLDRERIG